MNKFKIQNAFLLLIVIILFIWLFFIEPNKLEVKHYSISDNELKGIKIVFASDFHIKPHQQKRLQKIIQTINDQNPDIVLSVGDFVSGHIDSMTMPIEDIAKEFQNIKAPYGFYTTLGNHDQWFGIDEITKPLKENNVNVLNNSNAKVVIKEKDVYIAGVQYNPNYIDVGKSLENTGSPIIMLTHSPDEIVKMPEDINLILAGHTHGGQVVLPLIGPIFTCSNYGTKYAYGLIKEKGKNMIVTKGIGVSILPLRFNCVPEIVVIEFVGE